ncbi:MAG: sigma 54-interacting transcriptional regulator [Acidobacteriia bacterium]|nr:sigma 54-interacting transcriptional regulator [Terriglobia bacterium]
MSSVEQKYQAFLEMATATVSKLDPDGVFHAAVKLLRRLVDLNYAAVLIRDPEGDGFQIQMLEIDAPNPVLTKYVKVPRKGSIAGWVYEHRESLLIPDFGNSEQFMLSTSKLMQGGLRSGCAVPLMVRGRVAGILSIASRQVNAYTTEEQTFFEEVSRIVALAYDNATTYEQLKRVSRKLEQDNFALQEKVRLEQQYQLILELNNAIASHLNREELFRSLFRALHRYVTFDAASVVLVEEVKRVVRLFVVLSADEPRHIQLGGVHHPPTAADDFNVFEPQLEFPLEEDTLGQYLIQHKDIVLISDLRTGPRFKWFTDIYLKEGFLSVLIVPLIVQERLLGGFNFASREAHHFDNTDRGFLRQVADQVAIALRNVLAYEEITRLKNQLKEENVYLQEEIKTEQNFEEIVGQSRQLRKILRGAERVAKTDSTVLITGETGTGKELIARAIHDLSPRKERAFVKVNCAAIPMGLIESELFGHEKGAFTGAITRKNGRFELADGGSIFLDEIGEVPKDVQSKLLRVLQEHEFERVGGNKTIKVDVRIVAATNRDLMAMVQGGEFRQDLYYRLNIFPLHLPPLRDRRDDIVPLVHYFVHRHSLRFNKDITKISAKAIEALEQYPWPGNIRELENVIERGVILCEGDTLELKHVATALSSPEGIQAKAKTLEDLEREHILRTLEETGGVIGGPRGAAARLGINRTTLNSRMQKLGIRRSGSPHQFTAVSPMESP